MASQQLQQRNWQVISEQSRINPQPGNVSTMVSVVSEMVDADAAIEAAYSNTVPATVHILLFGRSFLRVCWSDIHLAAPDAPTCSPAWFSHCS
jgi:hypothetical protein